jgi:short chain dehydrogenase
VTARSNNRRQLRILKNLKGSPRSRLGANPLSTRKPIHGEETYRGSGNLMGRVALITGADSGIGKAVAIAFAREGADVAISYLEEQDDADDTAR